MTVESPEMRVSAAGDYSPVTVNKLSSESIFRELDDAFLQTQTRIWLGEVLKIRFDEETSISDILADGELLFELSEVLLKMQPTLFVNPTQSKSNERKVFASSKSTQRYMPYHNVGSFVKMCKNLGLNDIDLFSPSDVVDKRNTRKVCICMRSLSKKARSKDLNVPDFDSVTCTLSMPTNMVEGIRKSLETSQSSSSQSGGQDPEKISRFRYWKKMSNSGSAVSNGSSDISDDAESRFIADEAHGLTNYAGDDESLNISCSEVARDYSSALQQNVKSLVSEDDDQCEYLSPCNAESVGSPCSQYLSDQDISIPSVNSLGSHVNCGVELHREAKPAQNYSLNHVPIDWGDNHLDEGNYSNHLASVDVRNHSDALANDKSQNKAYGVSLSRKDADTVCSSGNDAWSQHFEGFTHISEIDFAKSSCNEIEQVSFINSSSIEGTETKGACEYVSVHDFDTTSLSGILMSCLEDAQVTVSTARRELVIDEASCYGKAENESTSYELSLPQSCVSIPEDISEISSSIDENNTGSLGRDSLTNYSTSENFPFRLVEKHTYGVDCNAHNFKCSNRLAVKANGHDSLLNPSKCFVEGFPGNDVSIVGPENGCLLINSEKELFGNVITSDHTEEFFGSGFMDGEASNSIENPHRLPAMVLDEDNSGVSEKDIQHTKVDSEDLKVLDGSKNVKPIGDDDTILTQNVSAFFIDPQFEAELPGCAEYTSEKHQPLAENFERGNLEYVKQEDAEKEMPQRKPLRKLLKTVAKGTALFGIAVFLLQLRKHRQEKLLKDNKNPTEAVKRNAPSPLSRKGQKGGNTSSVYPAEKLKFGF